MVTATEPADSLQPPDDGVERSTRSAYGVDDSFELLATRYGLMRVPGGSDLISRFLRDFGEWGWLEASFVAGFVEKGARVLDGGAYVGTFTLTLAERLPGLVVAVEANPPLLPLLRHNLSSLATGWSTVEHGLLGDGVSPVLAPHATHENNLGSTTFKPVTTPGAVATEGPPVPPLSLKTLRERHGPFDLLKLDIEGFELAALQADAEWLAAHKPTLWLECNEDPAVLPLYDLVAELGYELHYFAFPSFNPLNHRLNPEPIFAVAYEAGLLAVRPGSVVALPDAQVLAECDLVRLRDRAHLRECLWLTPRWGLPEWSAMPRSQLLAMCSRLYRRHSLDDFLRRF